MSSRFLFLRFGRGLELCRMSPPFAPSCCRGFVGPLKACRVSPFFELGELRSVEMITIHHLLPCSYYVGLVTALEVCHMSPSFVPSRCMGKGFVRALEASRISTFFELVGFGGSV